MRLASAAMPTSLSRPWLQSIGRRSFSTADACTSSRRAQLLREAVARRDLVAVLVGLAPDAPMPVGELIAVAGDERHGLDRQVLLDLARERLRHQPRRQVGIEVAFDDR